MPDQKSYEQRAIEIVGRPEKYIFSPGTPYQIAIRECALRLEAEDLLRRSTYGNGDEAYLRWTLDVDKFLRRPR